MPPTSDRIVPSSGLPLMSRGPYIPILLGSGPEQHAEVLDVLVGQGGRMGPEHPRRIVLYDSIDQKLIRGGRALCRENDWIGVKDLAGWRWLGEPAWVNEDDGDSELSRLSRNVLKEYRVQPVWRGEGALRGIVLADRKGTAHRGVALRLGSRWILHLSVDVFAPEDPGELFSHLGIEVRGVDWCSLVFGMEPLFVYSPQSPIRIIGTEDIPAAAVIARMVREELRLARFYESGIIDDVDSECLHQYRVHLRRIRTLLRFSVRHAGSGLGASAAEAFRNLQRRTNTLRDLDVQAADLGGSEILRHRRSEWTAVRGWLDSGDYRENVEGFDRIFAAEAEAAHAGGESIGSFARRALAAELRSFRKRSADVLPTTPDAELHKLRIKAKRIRYAVELFEPVYPPDIVSEVQKKFRRIQNSLGSFVDVSVQIDRVRRSSDRRRLGDLKAKHRRLKTEVVTDLQGLSRSRIEAIEEALAPPPTEVRE